jgi:hypothetical protein
LPGPALAWENRAMTERRCPFCRAVIAAGLCACAALLPVHHFEPVHHVGPIPYLSAASLPDQSEGPHLPEGNFTDHVEGPALGGTASAFAAGQPRWRYMGGSIPTG